ncbi:Clp domain protein [Hyphomicrobium denitrificans ATCC 51888]|uniref:Clp domain protein n=1 Tax=Hyphomicrobium denitrificans (strain ATCC 51888 / DSM 1869 / NCIMB 11706 / TK 0415) TaxID=582899 RepID=D8JXN2_HYPDA|nr:Clp protease N-terminal domain-containing protein [Hyphomicrobium denitrificans]ADJ25213.1 Clp domain protein [Hyphomicrobium denitrificans ATCC 51888]
MGVTAADLAQIPMSPDLGATLSRGAEFAAGAGAPDVALEHLLAALCDDSDAIAVLDASNVNTAALKSDVVGQFSQPGFDPEQAPTSLGVSADVRRILEAAAAAARGSRRRDINGAIVLAAIVGDGRSLAADILQAHGLTFDSAIRALQQALASAPVPQRAPAAQPPVADDVLARARERVQSRSTPSLRDLMKDMPQPATPPPAPPGASGQVHPGSEAEASPASVAPSAPEPTLEPSPPPAPRFEPQPTDANPAVPQRPAPAQEGRPSPQFGSQAQRGRDGDSTGQGAPGGPQDRPYPAQQPPFEPSLDLHERAVAQPSVRATLPGQPHVPAPPMRGQQPPQSPPGQGYPGELPRPRPMGGPPPPIPDPIAPGSPGMRIPFPGPIMPAPVPGVPPSPMQTDSGLRAEARGDQPPVGPAPAQSAPSKEKSAGRKRGRNAKVETGQLAENIPRTMRVGKTERVEVRIAKASIKSLAENLDGGGAAWQHQITVTKAMAVRVRAPDGGFFIETASPETQWIENNLGYGAEDFASWRFLITPQARGWSQLQIVVSARTIGADGVAAETALPDQIIEVKVRRNLKRTFARLFGWSVAAIVGGALSTFGESGLTTAKALLEKFMQ